MINKSDLAIVEQIVLSDAKGALRLIEKKLVEAGNNGNLRATLGVRHSSIIFKILERSSRRYNVQQTDIIDICPGSCSTHGRNSSSPRFAPYWCRQTCQHSPESLESCFLMAIHR